jgi:hypothetical protein
MASNSAVQNQSTVEGSRAESAPAVSAHAESAHAESARAESASAGGASAGGASARGAAIYNFGVVQALNRACGSGHLEIAQGLADQFESATAEPSHLDCSTALRLACENGHLGVVQWLAPQSPAEEPGISAGSCVVSPRGRPTRLRLGETDNNRADCICCAFLSACSGGHLAVAQWLASLLAPQLAPLLASQFASLLAPQFASQFATGGVAWGAFRQACVNGHLEVAKWLDARSRQAAGSQPATAGPPAR